MTPADAAAIAGLCRAARRRVLDTEQDIVAFVAGILARGPIEPTALIETLAKAGIGEDRWRAAADALAPKLPVARVMRSHWLGRLLAGRSG